MELLVAQFRMVEMEFKTLPYECALALYAERLKLIALVLKNEQLEHELLVALDRTAKTTLDEFAEISLTHRSSTFTCAP